MDMLDFPGMDAQGMDRLLRDAAEGSFSGELAPWMDEAVDQIVGQTKLLMGTVVEYRELLMRYACAIKTVRAKFEVLNTEFKIRYQRNPISSFSTRLKSTSSIVEKLSRKGLPFSLENIQEQVQDVAGVRVICSYIDDIYTIADALLRQDDVTLVRKKDFIAQPQPNGYRSLHLIVSVPVYFADQKLQTKVEVQIRTIAMDFWASLEHQLKYKQEVSNQGEIVKQLKECAERIHITDLQMQRLRCQIEREAELPTEEELLLDKLSQMDIAIE